ncbi:transcriptional regulator GntR family (plasmid) [Cupriavidus necator N-1]|uniref:Transcriptional regulator GntR family n=1 Tax=Cupriavidus necator (strain ATCC 43291 / DSM 13513 / CCUG 52238 / LMG 8453 / N-1) TaxID=1042878 RepID=F8GY12_CUPNN|nr:GntR family transcriptional regulator [Cupriavidus necator]AEI83136.1 transcriptional regulator GntR family [Cupriavidus necator N-1]MDX6008544.1 GntR family transcriptional regulator [Cupriavidus necator]
MEISVATSNLEEKPSPKPEARKRTSLSSAAIYERVKNMAATFELRPGERINEIDLSKQLDVSRTPLREVLNQLMVEGFLERTTNKGFVSRPLDVKQIFDLYEYRLSLETAIGRLACQRATDDEIVQLERSVQEDAAVPEDSDSNQLLALDEAFHMRLAHLTRNDEFVRALSNVNARIHYVRWIDMRNGRRPYTQAEHMQIVQALKARDEVALVKLLEGHIARRKEQITEVIKLGFSEIYTRQRG